MGYKFLLTILKPNRILDIYLAEKAEIERRKPLVDADRKNKFIEELLENPNYRIVNGRPILD